MLNCEVPTICNAAATAELPVTSVAHDAAVRDRQRARVGDAAPMVRQVAHDAAVCEGQRAVVENAAAISTRGGGGGQYKTTRTCDVPIPHREPAQRQGARR